MPVVLEFPGQAHHTDPPNGLQVQIGEAVVGVIFTGGHDGSLARRVYQTRSDAIADRVNLWGK